MKKSSLLLTLILAVAMITGCGGSGKAAGEFNKAQDFQSFMAKINKIEAGTYEPVKLNIEVKELTDEQLKEKYGPENLTEKKIQEEISGIKWDTNSNYEQLADSRAKKGGMLRIGMSGYPATLRPVGEGSSYVFNSTLQSMVYESLTDLHPITLKTIPLLADKWSISDDKSKYYFHINPKAKWQDGVPVNAYDYVATWDLMMDDGLKQPFYQDYYGQFKRPVALTKSIVRVEPRETKWRNFMAAGSMTIFPEHIIGRMSAEDYMNEFQNKLMLGSGPYLFKEAKTNEYVIMQRNKDYWDKDSYSGKYTNNFNQVKFFFHTEQSMLGEKLKKGDIDLYQVGVARRWHKDFVPEKIDAIKYNHLVKQRIYNKVPQGLGGWAFNLREEPFNDKRVRLAIYHLINRKKMFDKLFFNEYKYKDSYFPNSIYENPNNPKIRYNPEKAIELLEEAGWYQANLNEEGFLTKDGKVLEFDLGTTGNDVRVETVLQEGFAEVGVKLNIQKITWPTFLKEKNERLFKFTSMNLTQSVFPNPKYQFHSEFADKLNTNNVWGYKNKRVDEICELENVTYDIDKRVELLRELDGIVTKEYIMAFNWYADNIRGLYWNKFDMPEFVVSKYTRYLSDAAMGYWWFDAEKAFELEQARGTTKKLEGRPEVVKYWDSEGK